MEYKNIIRDNLENRERLLNIIINYLQQQMNNEYFKKLDPGFKSKQISGSIWAWTERNGKFGCELWSEEALKIYEKYDGKFSKMKKYLTHEHIIPRNIVEKNLLSCDGSLESIKSIILKTQAAVITREEDKLVSGKLRSRMPEQLKNKKILDYTKEDIFARYSGKGIRLININTLEQVI